MSSATAAPPASCARCWDGHRPVLWVSDLYGAQRGHAEEWQICLAHQLRDCQFAIEAGDAIFAPRMKMLLLRAFAFSRGDTAWPRAQGVVTASDWTASLM